MTETSAETKRAWARDCGQRYWPINSSVVELLCPRVQSASGAAICTNYLPAWAADLGVDGKLLAYQAFSCIDPETPEWARTDWLLVAWHMLAGSEEREHEAKHGPILSYATRLPARMRPLFERAWVNRIFLFLRRWAAHQRGQTEEELFGPVPRPSIALTHDVDAISLTPEIRAKQVVFQAANSIRSALRGDFSRMAARWRDAVRFAFSGGDFRTLELVRAMERQAGLTSTLHFYGGPPGISRLGPVGW